MPQVSSDPINFLEKKIRKTMLFNISHMLTPEHCEDR